MRPTAVAHSQPCLSLNQKTRCILPCGHGRSPSGEVGTPARRGVLPMRHAFRFTVVGLFFDFFCPSGTAFRPLAKLGTPARRAARRGRLWGFAPCAAPLASPPKHPLREVFSFLNVARARVLCCGSFPHSLRSLRCSPSATRKCQSTLSLWMKVRFSQIPPINLTIANGL